MDRIKWDSEVCDEYLANLQRVSQCVNEQIQQLTSARKSLLRQGVTASDKTLTEILERLETTLENMNAASDRVSHLMESLELSMDTFRSTEKRIGEMGTDMLYISITKNGLGSVLVTPYSSPFAERSITPDWLSQIAGTAQV